MLFHPSILIVKKTLCPIARLLEKSKQSVAQKSEMKKSSIPNWSAAHHYSDRKKYQMIASTIKDNRTAMVTRSGEIGALPPTRPVCPFTIKR